MTAGEPLLAVTGLRVWYGQALALDDVSFEISAGQSLAVLGPNGAGKSTLARTVSGLVRLEAGAMRFDGIDVTKMPADRIRRRGLLHLPEGRGIFPALTVVENLRMATALLPRDARNAAVERGLETFPSLAARRTMKAGTLSGGEQQMLAMSRAFILRPKLLVADEMSLGLAPILVDRVFEALAALKKDNVTIMIVEQFVHRALAFADQVVLLSRGRVAWQGPAGSAKHEVIARYLGETAAATVA